ncbi:MAG: type I methionyl aminopeptidase [Patescibacteria group bacterium]
MILIKTDKEIASMREGGRRLAEIIEEIGRKILPGKSTLELDQLAEKLVFAKGGVPAFKGYGKESGKPFPGTICVSINQEVVHGIPKEEKIIQEGDLVTIDIGMKYEGMITDMARTYGAGKISREVQKIIEVSREALRLGETVLKDGIKLGDYSRAVEKYVHSKDFFVCRDLVGHGVGRELHEDPYVPNYVSGAPEEKIILKKNMTLALEPIINGGTYEVKLGRDGWVWETKDGSLSAQFEDTVVITEDGCEILTKV